MTAPRWNVMALVVLFTPLVLVSRATAQSSCVPFITCPTDNQKTVVREPFSSKTWMVFNLPGSPASDRIYLTNDNVISHIQTAMRTYTSLDAAIPYDYTSTSSGDDTYQWGWVPQSDVSSNQNRRSGVPAAAMGLAYTNCRITTSIGKFAYNPTDGVRLMCWTGNWCNPPWCTTTLCGDTTNLDYQSAAVHEYGHALGLSHSGTGGATMAAAMFPQDSSGRILLACERADLIYRYNHDNPAAATSGFRVERDQAGVTVRWDAQQELTTAKYLIDYAPSFDGPFTHLGSMDVNGLGSYAYQVPNGPSGVYQLREVETKTSGARGDTLFHWSDVDVPATTPAPYTLTLGNIDSTCAALLQGHARAMAPMTVGPPQEIIYTEAAYVRPAQYMADVRTNYLGQLVRVVLTDTIGGAAASKAYTRAAMPNGGYVLNFNDCRENMSVDGTPMRDNISLYARGFTRDNFPSEASKNKMPLYYTVDTDSQRVSLSYWTPFRGSDWWYVDFDNDGLPDPDYYIGRLPVADTTQAWAVAFKQVQQMFQAPTVPANMMPPADFWTYARNYGRNSGAYTKLMYDSLLTYVAQFNPHLFRSGIACTDAHPMTTAQRNGAVRNNLNAGRSSVTVLSSVSQMYELGAMACLDVAGSGNYFDVNTLTPSAPAFGFWTSCGMGIDRTRNPAVGEVIANRLLYLPNRGFWGFFGATRGTSTTADMHLARECMRLQYGSPSGVYPTIGQVTAGGVRATALLSSDDAPTAQEYILIGDPMNRLVTAGPEVVGVDVQFAAHPLGILPNPSHGQVLLTFSLPTRSVVDLAVIDVQGRLVKNVIGQTLLDGRQEVRWNGRDASGRVLPSGIYFARLRVGTQVFHQKLALLR